MADLTAPTRVEHLLPPGATPGPVELSVVVPALNEAITVGEFLSTGAGRAWLTPG